MLNLSKIIKENEKKWVALTSDNKTLVASGDTLGQVLKLADKKGIRNPSVLKVPKVSNLFVG